MVLDCGLLAAWGAARDTESFQSIRLAELDSSQTWWEKRPDQVVALAVSWWRAGDILYSPSA